MLNFLSPQIAIVDDKKSDVIGIIDELNNRGIGCKFYNADLNEGDNFPEHPIPDIKIIFLDLYYGTSTIVEDTFDPELVVPWVNSIISPNSFYVLVIWSKDTHQAEAVLDELRVINKSPIYHLTKSKGEYQNESSYNFEQLLNDISQELENKPELMEMILWRQGILAATGNIITGITNNAAELNRKIKKIILAQGGISIKEKSSEIKKEALYDALDSVLYTNSKNNRDLNISATSESEIYASENFADETLKKPLQDSQLNNWFIFQRNPIRTASIEPGSLFKINKSFFKNMYSITLENSVKEIFFKDVVNPSYIDIAILLTPSCNIAQDKIGNNYKLLSGLYFENPVRKDDGSPKHFKGYGECYKIIDNVDLDGKVKGVMIFDYRYIFTIPKTLLMTNERFTKIAVFSKDLLSDFQVGYSSYSSRIGYTEIL